MTRSGNDTRSRSGAATQRRAITLLAALVLAGGCGSDLGPCDRAAADELVYGRSGLVATKGQALAHDSCGNGVFCHSSAAHADARFGVPAGLSFDMLPAPDGLSNVLEHVDMAWAVVADGDMPPRGDAARVQGDGDWLFDVERRAGAPRLPALSSAEGKGMFRNWLACGAPVVAHTQVPKWAVPARDPFEGDATPRWQDIYEVVLQPSCALSGCHSESSASGGLAMTDACGTHAALFVAGACGEPAVQPGDAAASLLVDKLTSDDPRCGDPMPPIGRLPQSFTDAIAEWIDAGAEADACQ